MSTILPPKIELLIISTLHLQINNCRSEKASQSIVSTTPSPLTWSHKACSESLIMFHIVRKYFHTPIVGKQLKSFQRKGIAIPNLSAYLIMFKSLAHI